MRGPNTPLKGVIESFITHRHDLSARTAQNYRYVLGRFEEWCAKTLARDAVVGDVEPGTVDAYLSDQGVVSRHLANATWVALRSFAAFLSERRIHQDHGESALRHVKRPKVKDDPRRALADDEMWRVIQAADQGAQGGRDLAIIWTLLGCGLRREELASLRLGDVNLPDRLIHVRATASKSVHARDVTMPVEVVKELDHYIADVRNGEQTDEAPLFTVRLGGPLTGNAIRLIFDRLKIRTGIRDLCAHICRHTWATNYNRSASGSKFDLQVEGGWTTGRMVDRYCKVRPVEERRRAPSVFSASRRAVSERRLSGRRSSGKRDARRVQEVA